MSARLPVSPLADPWSDALVDLESLNAQVTDAIAKAAIDLNERALRRERGPRCLPSSPSVPRESAKRISSRACAESSGPARCSCTCGRSRAR